MATIDHDVQRMLRALAPEVLGIVVRRWRDLPAAEDAVQEALIAAAASWRKGGVPESPKGWLIHVATRRLTDAVRAEAARRHREALVVSLIPLDEQVALAADEATPARDDTLDLLFMCCHPALTPASAIALTLRAVGGLGTAEIARAFLVPEPTMAQRISRAKQAIRAAGSAFQIPTELERRERLRHVIGRSCLRQGFRCCVEIHSLGQDPRSNRTCGFPAYGLPTALFGRLASASTWPLRVADRSSRALSTARRAYARRGA
jgi:RNA polymerase sigma factor (sigma-70 family)